MLFNFAYTNYLPKGVKCSGRLIIDKWKIKKYSGGSNVRPLKDPKGSTFFYKICYNIFDMNRRFIYE